jgi:4-hydroxyphenylacetate 3-monooxygenase
MRTGKQYLESLRDGRVVRVGGEIIDDIVDHPLTSGYAHAIAEYYDMHHDPELQEVLTFVDTDGIRRAIHWMVPRSAEDLRTRRAYHEFWARHFKGGMFARPPASTNCVIFGTVDDPEPWEANSIGHHGKPLAQYIRAAWDRVRDDDLYLTPMFVDVQYDRSRAEAIGESPALSVVSTSGEGVVLRGWKSIGTPPIFGNEIAFGAFARPGITSEQVVFGLIPANTPGVTHVARASNARPAETASDRFEHPLAHIGDELDSMAYFDDVFVPWQRIMHIGSPEHAMQYPQRQFDWIHVETQIRQVANAELMLGLALLLTESLGTAKIPLVQSQLADFIRFKETCHAFTIASEATCFSTENGMYKPNPKFVNFGRAYYLEDAPSMIDRLLELCGRGVVLFPALSDIDDPVLGPRLLEALGGGAGDARERLAIFKLIHERFLTEWGARHAMFEKFNGTPLHVIKALTVARADYQVDGEVTDLARRALAS